MVIGGRTKGKRTGTFRVLIYLAQTPEKVGSIGWDAKQTRVATQAL